jgi:hypothetical protein
VLEDLVGVGGAGCVGFVGDDWRAWVRKKAGSECVRFVIENWEGSKGEGGSSVYLCACVAAVRNSTSRSLVR